MKHDTVGTLVALTRGIKQYWYVHHKWQKDTVNCYVGPVGKIDVQKKYMPVLGRRGISYDEAMTAIMNRYRDILYETRDIKASGDLAALTYIAEVMGQ
ncbi:MAG: hypothetical protein JRN00_05910 [Nitrososphaerota archaeon]|nr:hypothetical protein [Nitrososphaerota archaeon]